MPEKREQLSSINEEGRKFKRLINDSVETAVLLPSGLSMVKFQTDGSTVTLHSTRVITGGINGIAEREVEIDSLADRIFFSFHFQDEDTGDSSIRKRVYLYFRDKERRKGSVTLSGTNWIVEEGDRDFFNEEI